MPEPNLPPLNLDSVDLDVLRDSIPEMPDLTREALSAYSLRPQDVEIMVVSMTSLVRKKYVSRLGSDLTK